MNKLAYVVTKLKTLYENLDSYSNNQIREKLDEIIKELRGYDNETW